ncbi:MAG: endonuclease Q family protein [Candidatus Bathyarchaeota archaeon]
MRIIADLHIHGCHSRGTSEKMHIREIAGFAKTKGLTIIGTGDFTHPKWLEEIQTVLTEESETSLFKVVDNIQPDVSFILTSEVSTIFTFEDSVKKIHHVILTPNIETAVQINDRLAKYGDLTVDGRPTLKMSASSFVEEIMTISSENMVFPAHIWTPWFSLFGDFSGFNDINECYEDMTHHISALETGLSSDPAMNWRLSKLDNFTLISNSDSHSYWPWRIGREANVFELDFLSYQNLLDAIRFKEKKQLKFTIETHPEYGKYHWSGHRKCNLSLSPVEAIKLGNICPICHRKLTKGVEQRVEELADRPVNYRPVDAVDFLRLLPLSEIIKTALEVSSPYTRKVWDIYNRLIMRFGNEYVVLIDALKDDLEKIVGDKIAGVIVDLREGKVGIVPGYDGVYGKLVLLESNFKKTSVLKENQQQNLKDFV